MIALWDAGTMAFLLLNLRDPLRALLHQRTPRTGQDSRMGTMRGAQWEWACARSARPTDAVRAPASPTRPKTSPI